MSRIDPIGKWEIMILDKDVMGWGNLSQFMGTLLI